MFWRFLDWLNFKLTHIHDWADAGAAEQLGSEKYYWHNEECAGCPKRRTVLNNKNYWRPDND